MLREIMNLQTNVIGVAATGTVTAKDYEDIMIPIIEEKLKTYPKIKFLYYIDAEFENYELKAMFDDAKLGIKYFNALEKIAVVSDLNWIKNGVQAFGFMMPGEVKVFDIANLDNAKEWIQR